MMPPFSRSCSSSWMSAGAWVPAPLGVLRLRGACAVPALAWFGRRGRVDVPRRPGEADALRLDSVAGHRVGLAVGVAAPVFPLMVAGFALVF